MCIFLDELHYIDGWQDVIKRFYDSNSHFRFFISGSSSLSIGGGSRESLAAHWIEFVAHYTKWIRPVVFENVCKILACRTAVPGCHVYECESCGHIKIVPHSCKSRFCPTCGKHAADVWSSHVLNNLPDVPCHHLVMSERVYRRGSTGMSIPLFPP
ncbi:MAG: transposase zinc-binding domain-containing protein [Candidatus Xenobiia bacterium LiM19]